MRLRSGAFHLSCILSLAMVSAAPSACTTRERLMLIPCTDQTQCDPYGLVCDPIARVCATCPEGMDCSQLGSGGAAGSSAQGGTAGAASGGSTAGGAGGSVAGSTGSGGDGTGGSAGSTGSGGTGGTGPTACVPVTGAPGDLLIYDGTPGASGCDDRLNPPHTGHWFAFNDGTGQQTPAAGQVHAGVLNGRGGANDCMIQTQGSNFSGWGGSLKLWLNYGQGVCSFDASNYSGIRFYIRGSTNGTMGPGSVAADNTVRVNVPTRSTASVDQGGACVPEGGPCDDSYGTWCTVTPDWTQCEVPFDNLSQSGWGMDASFLKSEILSLQIQASRYEAGGGTVSWDLYVDDVTFY